MVNLALEEMKVIGKVQIGINGYVFLKIDRVFCNVLWIIKYGYICFEFSEKNILDYIFIYFKIVLLSKRGIRFFRFLNVIFDYEDFLSLVNNVW